MSVNVSRRVFLATPLLFQSNVMNANPLNLPIGLQLYTVGKEMEDDAAGTLKRVAAAGYQHVELSPMAKIPSKDLRKLLDDAGLQNPSGHYMLPDLLSNLQQKIDDAKVLGEQYMVVTVPWVADPSRVKPKPGEGQMEYFLGILNGLTLDDWKWNANQFNRLGEQTRKAGLQLAYHNHNFEFKTFGDTTGYDTFLRLTDPDLVKFELDCGWVVVAGKDPAAYLTAHPGRYRLLHIKDFKPGFTPRTALMDKSPNAPVPTELGRGTIDYAKIFKAARSAKIQAYFVEQEPPFVEMPALEAIQVNYQYLKNLKA